MYLALNETLSMMFPILGKIFVLSLMVILIVLVWAMFFYLTIGMNKDLKK